MASSPSELAAVMGGDMPPEAGEYEGDKELIPEDYLERIAEVFPEMDEDRKMALWEAIAACVEALR